MMNWNDFERHFSTARVGRYHTHYHGNDARAMGAYAHNLLLAEATLPLLNVLEIALRNRLHEQMAQLYSRQDWWEALRSDQQFIRLVGEVDKAKAKLHKRCEAKTVDKIVAELTFGFWSSLFNTHFQHTLWKRLRLAFAHCPQQIRKRHTISAALNEARDWGLRCSGTKSMVKAVGKPKHGMFPTQLDSDSGRLRKWKKSYAKPVAATVVACTCPCRSWRCCARDNHRSG